MTIRSLLQQNWTSVTLYRRFESMAAVVMTILVSFVIVVAIIRLAVSVTTGLVVGAMNPLDHKVFEGVFGDIVTVMIALEFNRSLQYVARGKKSIFQTQVILLVALLAVARKFILEDLTPVAMLGLAAIALALGIVYWLLREHEDRIEPGQSQPTPEPAPTDRDV